MTTILIVILKNVTLDLLTILHTILSQHTY
jgi:hypothetical protein